MFKNFLVSCIIVLFVLVACFVVVFILRDVQEISFLQCVDGDTAWFLIDGKKEKVRFLAIDAPEIAHEGNKADYYGDSAKEFVCKKLKKAKNISIEYDPSSSVHDKYGRVLGWIFVDGDNLNELLVSRGYAMVRYVYGDYSYLDRLCYKQEKAYQQELGLWKYKKDIYKDNYCVKKK